jgi:hypothetical protein
VGARGICAGLAAFWLAIGLAVLLFSSGWVRGAVGDLAVVAFMAHLAGIVWPGDVRVRAAVCLAIAALTEGAQWFGAVGPDDPRWLQVLIGRTADPLDLLVYVVSAVLAVVGERMVMRAVRTTG